MDESLWKRANLTQPTVNFCHPINRLIPGPPREVRQITNLDLREIIKVMKHAREVRDLKVDTGGIYLAPRCQTEAEQMSLSTALGLGTPYNAPGQVTSMDRKGAYS